MDESEDQDQDQVRISRSYWEMEFDVPEARVEVPIAAPADTRLHIGVEPELPGGTGPPVEVPVNRFRPREPGAKAEEKRERPYRRRNFFECIALELQFKWNDFEVWTARPWFL